jgi:hypothetical protein
MRALAWSLLGVSILVLVGGVAIAFSYTDMYGGNGWGEAISQGWWILAVAAVPAMAGWLVLRIATRAAQQ